MVTNKPGFAINAPSGTCCRIEHLLIRHRIEHFQLCSAKMPRVGAVRLDQKSGSSASMMRNAKNEHRIQSCLCTTCWCDGHARQPLPFQIPRQTLSKSYAGCQYTWHKVRVAIFDGRLAVHATLSERCSKTPMWAHPVIHVAHRCIICLRIGAGGTGARESPGDTARWNGKGHGMSRSSKPHGLPFPMSSRDLPQGCQC